jgi:hypothetical protein
LYLFFLSVTSIIFHSKNNIYTNLLDKVSIFLVVYEGYIIMNHKIYNINSLRDMIYFLIISVNFMIINYLFYYGYIYNKYCYTFDKNTSNMFHSLLHYICFIGF